MADLSSDPLNIFRSLTGLLRPIGQALARPEVMDLLRKGSIAAGALYGSPIVAEQLRELAEEQEERRRQKLAEENAELAQKAFSALGMPLPKDTAKALLMGGLQLRDIIRFSTPTYEETPMGIFEIPPALSLFGGAPVTAEPSAPTVQAPETQSAGTAAIGRKPRLVVPFEDPRQALTWPTGDVGSLAISLAQEAARASGRKVTPEDAWAMIPRARAILASERVSAQPPPEWKPVPGLEGLFYQSTPSGPKLSAVPLETLQAMKQATEPPLLPKGPIGELAIALAQEEHGENVTPAQIWAKYQDARRIVEQEPREALSWPTGDAGEIAIALAQEAAKAQGRKATPQDAWAMIPTARFILASERQEWRAVPGLGGVFFRSTPTGPELFSVPSETLREIKKATEEPKLPGGPAGDLAFALAHRKKGNKVTADDVWAEYPEAQRMLAEQKLARPPEALTWPTGDAGSLAISLAQQSAQAQGRKVTPEDAWAMIPTARSILAEERLREKAQPQWKPVPNLEGWFYRSTPTGLEFSSIPPETVKATKQATEPPQLPKGPIGDMAIALARQEKGPDVTPEDIWAKYPEAQQIVTERTRRPGPDDRPIGAFTDRVFVDEKGEPAKDLTMTVNEALKRGYTPMSATAEDAFTSRKLSLQMLQNLRTNIEELNRLGFYAHDNDHPATRAFKQTWARLQLQVAPPGPLRLMQAQATQLIRILRDLGEKGNLAKTAWEPAKEGLLPSDTTYEGAITLLRMLDSEIRAYLPERLGHLSLAYPGPYLPHEWKEMVKYWEEQFSKSPEQRTGEGLPLFAVNPYSPSDPLRRRATAPTPAPTPLPTPGSKAEELLRKYMR